LPNNIYIIKNEDDEVIFTGHNGLRKGFEIPIDHEVIEEQLIKKARGNRESIFYTHNQRMRFSQALQDVRAEEMNNATNSQLDEVARTRLAKHLAFSFDERVLSQIKAINYYKHKKDSLLGLAKREKIDVPDKITVPNLKQLIATAIVTRNDERDLLLWTWQMQARQDAEELAIAEAQLKAQLKAVAKKGDA